MAKNSPCSIKTKNKMAQAVKEFMNTKPFDKITVSDITEKCNIHRQTFYYHFQDRYELLDWIIYNELLEPFMDDFTFDNMFDKFRQLLETVYSEKKFYHSALHISSGEVSLYLSNVSKKQFASVLCSLAKTNDIDMLNDENALLIAEFFGYGLSGIVLSWVNGGMKETPEELTEKTVNLIEVGKIIASR